MKNAKRLTIILSTVFSVLLTNNAVANSPPQETKLDQCVLNPSNAACESKYRKKLQEAKENKEPAKATQA
jgi:hypothetical protein